MMKLHFRADGTMSGEGQSVNVPVKFTARWTMDPAATKLTLSGFQFEGIDAVQPTVRELILKRFGERMELDMTWESNGVVWLSGNVGLEGRYVFPQDLRNFLSSPIIYTEQRNEWGRQGSTGPDRLIVASRGAVGLVKSGNQVIANNNYAYAA